MDRLLFSSCLLLVLSLSSRNLSWSQQAVAAADATASEEPLARLRVTLPIHLYWGYLVIVEGSIGNIDKLHLLVDTGASPSVIDEKIAQRLGLTEETARVNLWNKSFETRRAMLPSLRLGPVHAVSLPVLAEDLSFLQKAIGQRVDGIVGLDVLSKSSFTINYRAKEIVFGPVESLSSFAPFDTEKPVVTIRMGFQDRRLRLVVDTGGPDMMLFRSRMDDSNGLQALGIENVSDVSGSLQRKKVRIPEVHLGEEIIGSQVAFVVNDRKDEGDNFDGVLGPKGSQFWKIAFDFEHRKFWWER